MNIKSTEWRHMFKLAKQIWRENKLKEFHYKFLHRIIVNKKELCLFGIKQDSDCLNCEKEDAVEYTFIHCQFSKAFQQRVVQWFNNVNYTNVNYTKTVFALFPTSSNTNETYMLGKLNYTCELHNRSITLSDFVTKLYAKYNVENID